jgi:hypothetical protein
MRRGLMFVVLAAALAPSLTQAVQRWERTYGGVRNDAASDVRIHSGGHERQPHARLGRALDDQDR